MTEKGRVSQVRQVKQKDETEEPKWRDEHQEATEAYIKVRPDKDRKKGREQANKEKFEPKDERQANTQRKEASSEDKGETKIDFLA